MFLYDDKEFLGKKIFERSDNDSYEKNLQHTTPGMHCQDPSDRGRTTGL